MRDHVAVTKRTINARSCSSEGVSAKLFVYIRHILSRDRRLGATSSIVGISSTETRTESRKASASDILSRSQGFMDWNYQGLNRAEARKLTRISRSMARCRILRYCNWKVPPNKLHEMCSCFKIRGMKYVGKYGYLGRAGHLRPDNSGGPKTAGR